MYKLATSQIKGGQWLSGRVLDSRPKGHGLVPHWHHCVASLSKNINRSLVLVQPRKTRPFITEKLWMGHKESKQNKRNFIFLARLCSLGGWFESLSKTPKTGFVVSRPI